MSSEECISIEEEPEGRRISRSEGMEVEFDNDVVELTGVVVGEEC